MTHTCQKCQAPFRPVNKFQKYCSSTCRRKADRGGGPRDCRQCGKTFSPVANQQYCSAACRFLYTGSEPKVKACVRCQREFTPSGNQTYCSPECRHASKTPRWKLNPDVEYPRNTWRKHVLAMTGGTCLDCGATEGLEVHHIIPRARGGKNVVGNGMVLCRPCHNLRHDPSMATDDLVERIARRVVEILDSRTSS